MEDASCHGAAAVAAEIKPMRFIMSSAKSTSDLCSENLGAKFAFVVHASELDSSSQSDSDSDWDDQGSDKTDSVLCDDPAFSDIIPPCPLSFHFTCAIYSAVPCPSMDLDADDSDSANMSAIQEANSKWNNTYANTPVKSAQDKVRIRSLKVVEILST